jgi:hypothetical protein
MTRLSIKLGYWSSVLLAIVFTVYIIEVVSMTLFFPLPPWTTLADFMAAIHPVSLVIYTLIQLAAFLSMPLAVILFCSLHNYAPDDKKILTRIALCAIVAAMVLGNQLYTVHFSAVRQSISEGISVGLDQFVEWNLDSVIMASGTLGWTFFYGLAFIFVAPVFSGGRLERGLRYASLICGSCGILGWIGSLLDSTVLGLVYFMGGTVSITITAVLASVLFKRLENKAALKTSSPESEPS